jgi:parvulin-like peptidyl-prolyl isomerase
MPVKKTISKRAAIKKASPAAVPVIDDTNNMSVFTQPHSDGGEGTSFVKPSVKRSWKLAIPAVLILAAFLLWFNRGVFIAATVNGQPIYKWDFSHILEQRFGAQTLEGLVSEKLIMDAAKKEGVSVSADDLKKKVDEIVASVGQGVTLDELLSFQGLTKTDFENQVKLQLTVEKILGKGLVISDADVDNFIATNRAMLKSTDAAQMKTEARQAILDKTISEKLQNWFSELRKNAVIEKYIK